MSRRVVAIGLKIPDNEAYTALGALRRLGVDVEHVERSIVWCFDDAGDADDLDARIRRNETVFNLNKHRLTILQSQTPRAGEAWIEEIAAEDEPQGSLGGRSVAGVSRARRYVGWLLLDRQRRPVSRSTLEAAVERLLCNSAIERATFPEK